MGRTPFFFNPTEKSITASRRADSTIVDLCPRLANLTRIYSCIVNTTPEIKEAPRDFFCVVRDAFRVFARRSSAILGSAWAFVGALFIIIVWALTGPTFHFSDTWQLIINTGTTIVTFLMVFLIRNTQNRDAKAVHLKLDEIIRALKGRA
jgi:hypothetical protein